MGQVFLIEREVFHKKTKSLPLKRHSESPVGHRVGHVADVTGFGVETALGIASRSQEQANAQRLLTVNCGHWAIENTCHYVIDWNYGEDRSRISKGNGPENVTRLRRFAVGVIKMFTKGKTSVAEKIQQLHRNIRLVFDYLRMTQILHVVSRLD